MKERTGANTGETHYFIARDGTRLAFRWFPGADSRYVLVSLHGSFLDGGHYTNLARLCSAHGISVCIPDWRGHGQSGGRFGDVCYCGQLEDDLRDLVAHLVEEGVSAILIGGHSAGSLVALRYLLRYGSRNIIGYFSIAPPLAASGFGAACDKPVARIAYWLRYLRRSPHTGVAKKAYSRFAPRFHPLRFALSMALPPFRSQAVLTFGKPDPDSGKVLGYTSRLTNSFNLPSIPRSYTAIDVPCHLFAGDNDEAVSPDYLDVIRHWYVPPTTPARLSVLPGANHMTSISAAAKPLAQWAQARIEACATTADEGGRSRAY